MKVSYIFVALGNVSLTPINATIFETEESRALKKSAELACSLFKAGYFSFCLYDVTTADHRLIKTFKVEQDEP